MRTLRPLIIALATGALGLTVSAAVSAQTFELLHGFVEPAQWPNGIVEGDDGSIYGTFSSGGPGNGGGILRRSSDGIATVQYAFSASNPAGFNPQGGLVRGADGAFYGTTTQGGENQAGALFRWHGGALTALHQFSGGRSWTGLSLGADGLLYGVSNENCGTIFRFDPDPQTRTFTNLYAVGCGSQNLTTLFGPLVVQDGSVYGISTLPGYGSIFRWNTAGFTTLHEFTGAEGAPMRIVKGSDGAIYGGTWAEFTTGILFRWSAGQFTTLHTFGRIATAALVQDIDGSLYGLAVSIDSAVPHTVFKWRAGSLTTLHEFKEPDQLRPAEILITASGRLAGVGSNGTGRAMPGGLFSLEKDGREFEELLLPNEVRTPSGDMVRMPDGTIYGTTLAGGASNSGTLFERRPNGTITILHAFTVEQGWRPGGVILGADGRLYGVAEEDGEHGCGMFFEWDGTAFHVRHAFSETDGCGPVAIIRGQDDAIYGTTRSGGSMGLGTLFRWDAGGLDVLHSFREEEGRQPITRLVQDGDGALYGSLAGGGEYAAGAVFKWHLGMLTRLHSFGGTPDDGAVPTGTMLLGADGALYGRTGRGGADNAGVLYRLTPTSYTVLHNFAAGEGSVNNHPLAMSADGSIVGVIVRNSINNTPVNFGSVFRWNGTALSTLHVFDLSEQSGAFPFALIAANDGNIYGSTLQGGGGGGGTLFRLVFVQAQAPVITSVTAAADPTPVNTAVTVSATFTDQEPSGHTCTFAWNDGKPDTTVLASGGACSASHAFAAAGVYTATVTVRDASGLSDVEVSPYIAIYDTSAGFVTGAGSIESGAGAYALNATLTGRARFAFVSRYQKGATIPTGNTEFRFDVASMKFSSDSYEWLVIAGARAQYKGRGTINGAGDYGFLLSATDGAVPGGGADAFRIKIWDRASGVVIYDNVAGASDTMPFANPQALATGSIVIHAK